MSKQLLRNLTTRFGIVGESAPMVAAATKLFQVAPTDLTVLVTGETGTGKEVFAHAIHELSNRKKNAFVSVNCAAIPETLLESELFGAEKGAFTGAVEQRKGFFETAHKGTIFLDEIGEMPIGTQVKLLRVLESGEFSRLGSSDVHKVDVRVVAATNRDLLYEVRQNKFRQDLYFRLNSVNIHLPPLRQHPEDIELLVEHFAGRIAERHGFAFKSIDNNALNMLEQWNWPGNVRELRNIIETLATLEQPEIITTDILAPYMPSKPDVLQEVSQTAALVRLSEPPSTTQNEADIQMIYRAMVSMNAEIAELKAMVRHLLALSTTMQPPSPGGIVAVQNQLPNQSVTELPSSQNDLHITSLEKSAIEQALRKTQGNRREAAKILGISERTLYRKIDEYGLM